ncbi:lysophospholipid transporter LplT [Paenibacillus athensensis]|uniref:Lysophospholipid transporter LplT n=1 Tax=Paenibacillus athensensis TaxID=1967502 RepID=A0A4Y8PQ49_9BACL|nr:lysophospholipid transporter LplT [Paenibacillus athensensis]MCD1260517.1 lysophospholipid transporter LplT [Paenibacillus athensensis]
MKRKQTALNSLYWTQFLSAFADNLNFFIIIGILTHRGVANPEGTITNIQIGFLLGYVLLAPVVGALADRRAKSQVLLLGNLFKGAGMLLLMLGVWPILCYVVLGIGAVVYSPAKYGILTELTDSEDQLLRANAMVEGSTIFAILLGTVVGGFLATVSDVLGVAVCLALYMLSLALTYAIPRKAGNPTIRYGASARQFFGDMRKVFANPRARFSLISTGSFWLTASVLRIALIAWLPANLGIVKTSQQSLMLGVTAVGVVLSAFFIPRLVPAGKLHRAYIFGYVMVGALMATAYQHSLVLTIILLMLIGMSGGVFLIPMNTMLQEEGKALIGAGKAIAIQNFVENSLTVLGLGFFTTLNALHVAIDLSVVIMGCVLLLFLLYVHSQLGKVKRWVAASERPERGHGG